jgi:hypothetical protein
MSALKLQFLSHGTLESRDLEKTRRLMIRLGGENSIAVVENPRKASMPLLNHNGLDVATREEVDECHRILDQGKEQWGLKKITQPADQHGTYSFYFAHLDDNWWEILADPRIPINSSPAATKRNRRRGASPQMFTTASG